MCEEFSEIRNSDSPQITEFTSLRDCFEEMQRNNRIYAIFLQFSENSDTETGHDLQSNWANCLEGQIQTYPLETHITKVAHESPG